jgi:hypothetical protein
VRNNTLDAEEIRWDILKSMLDDFPQLWDRAEQYLLDKRSSAQIAAANAIYPGIKELMQEVVREIRKERSRK